MTVRAQTFQAIPLRLREPFLEAVRALPMNDLSRFRWSPREVILATYHTAAHPEVFAHPRESGLQVFEGCVLFHRPKTGRPVGQGGQGIVVAPDLQPWLGDWIARLPRPIEHAFSSRTYRVRGPAGWITKTRVQDVCSEPIAYMVSTVCEELGFPGVTCRTLRHTCLNWVWLTSHNIRDVMDVGSVNQADAVLYCVENPEDGVIGRAMAERMV